MGNGFSIDRSLPWQVLRYILDAEATVASAASHDAHTTLTSGGSTAQKRKARLHQRRSRPSGPGVQHTGLPAPPLSYFLCPGPPGCCSWSTCLSSPDKRGQATFPSGQRQSCGIPEQRSTAKLTDRPYPLLRSLILHTSRVPTVHQAGTVSALNTNIEAGKL